MGLSRAAHREQIPSSNKSWEPTEDGHLLGRMAEETSPPFPLVCARELPLEQNRAANYRPQWFRLYALVTKDYGAPCTSEAREHQGSASNFGTSNHTFFSGTYFWTFLSLFCYTIFIEDVESGISNDLPLDMTNMTKRITKVNGVKLVCGIDSFGFVNSCYQEINLHILEASCCVLCLLSSRNSTSRKPIFKKWKIFVNKRWKILHFLGSSLL